jgi:hypothetical protein
MRSALSWLVLIGLLLTLSSVPSRGEAGPNDIAAAGCQGTIRFDNGAGTGLWQTAQNWDTDVLPGAADDVCIPAWMNVTLSSATQTINSVFVETGATLTVAGGTPSIAGASQVEGGSRSRGPDRPWGCHDPLLVGLDGQMTGSGTTHANAGIQFSGASVRSHRGSAAAPIPCWPVRSPPA